MRGRKRVKFDFFFFLKITKLAHMMFSTNNIFRTHLQQILIENCYLILLADKNNNFNSDFKLELLTIYYLRFVIKVL